MVKIITEFPHCGRMYTVWLTDQFTLIFQDEDTGNKGNLANALINAVGAHLRLKYSREPFTDENIEEYKHDFEEIVFNQSFIEQKMFINYVITELDNVINIGLQDMRKRIAEYEKERKEKLHGKV